MLKIKRLLLALVLLFGAQSAMAEEWIYTFRPGDTLWDLCAKYIAAPNCWQKIAERNQVEKPKQIKPGTRLYLPISWLKILPASVKVLSTRGDVKLLRPEQEEPTLLEKNAKILVGDQILTGEGTATLQFADESILIITPGSEVSFDTLSLYGESGMVDTRVRLNRGRAKAKVKPVQGPASRYEILTPAAVAAVRGTEFRVVSEATDPPAMRTEVLEGNVAVGNDSGEQALQAGFALKAVSGEKPAEPIKLLEPPVFVSELPEEIRALPWSLEWLPIEAADSYRVQVYEKGFFFDDLVKELQTKSVKYSVNQLEDGRYDILIRAIDKNGFEGLEAKYTANVTKPTAVKPVAATGKLKTVDGKQQIAWQWPAVEGADKYKLVLSADTKSEGSKKTEIEVIENHFEQGVSEYGKYTIKVAPIFGEQLLAYGDTESVIVRNEEDEPLWIKVLVGAIFIFVML
ncbi:MAG: FecR domain-containing protein [Pseudomonadales bacterium]|nr:FecR domain-containing protein [Pseudomonadales bacterium]